MAANEKAYKPEDIYEDYEEECSRCKGTGKVDGTWRDRYVECQLCQGRGLTLSDKGYDLIFFLQRYMRPKATTSNFEWDL